MRIIHGIKFEPELLTEYQQTIYQNIIKGESSNLYMYLVDQRKLGKQQPAVTHSNWAMKTK